MEEQQLELMDVAGCEEVVDEDMKQSDSSSEVRMDQVDDQNNAARRESTEWWDGKQARDYICPKCTRRFESGQFWIQCDVCKEWFHGDCVRVQEFESNEIELFHCILCEQDAGPSKGKPVTNNHRHDRTDEYAAGKPIQAGTPDFVNRLYERNLPPLPSDLILRTRGQTLTLPLLVKKGFEVPILVDTKDGLDLSVPDETFDVDEVVNEIGVDFEVDVIDVQRQISVKMTAAQFSSAFSKPKAERPRIYNCISLEVSKTSLGKRIRPPAVVNRLSWVEKCWPKDAENIKPAVSKYCLLSMANSYTDFHIDFGGTSVYYHILKGG